MIVINYKYIKILIIFIKFKYSKKIEIEK